MYIESMARRWHSSTHDEATYTVIGLNYRLKKSGSKMTVVAFIIMPATTHSYTIDALKGQAVTKQLRDTVTEIQNRVGARLFEHAIRSNGYVGFIRSLLDRGI